MDEKNSLAASFASLNEDQLRAACATEGCIRVIAGAGSGKTQALIHRYAYLVRAAGIPPSDILCVTFTNKAAGEMKKRVRALLGDGYDTSLITTYHGFCVRVLREDIHRLSLVPDLSDRSFAQNLSGVAMRYKLMGLEQLAAIKERWFREALKTRLRLFSACLSALGRPALEVEKTSVRFTRSLPQDREENARVISLLRDTVPREALLSLLPEEAGEIKKPRNPPEESA